LEALVRKLWLIAVVLLAACRTFTDHVVPDEVVAAGTPRLIAPASMSTVTQQRPTLRWVGTPDASPLVELCADRACSKPLPVATLLAGDNLSAAPMAALPRGWVYWRVRSVVGTQAVTSATWQFWVGATSASTAVDTSHGPILDVNGDGFADTLIGGDGATTLGKIGGAHLYLGAPQVTAAGWTAAGAPGRIDLSLDAEDGFGRAVANAGDVDGDGFADFLVSSYSAPGGREVAHLYFGSATPSAAGWNGSAPARRIDLIDPSAAASGSFGSALTAVGDVNGDGFADFVISDVQAGASTGASYLYFGSAKPSAAGWNGAAAAARVDLVNPSGIADEFGTAATGAGDVNGDGFADFVVGASSVSDAGSIYLYLGGAAAGAADWNGASPRQRIHLVGPDASLTQYGITVAGGGDINGDGYADFVVGAAGAAYVYLGSAMPGPAAWLGPSAAARLDLLTASGQFDLFGFEVAAAGDVNGDGFADFLVGASGFQTNVGAGDLYLGSATPSVATWNGGGATRRIHLTSPDGADVFAWAMGGGGDIDGDLNADFLISSLYASAVHLYRGAAAPTAARWNGAAPQLRLDLTGPGAVIGFGAAVASAGPTCATRYF
jgi:FG-GAP repeat protein